MILLLLFYFILFYFLYTWMYSFQGLKAIKTVLVRLLVPIVLGIESVVKKNCTESLHIIIIIIIIIYPG